MTFKLKLFFTGSILLDFCLYLENSTNIARRYGNAYVSYFSIKSSVSFRQTYSTFTQPVKITNNTIIGTYTDDTANGFVPEMAQKKSPAYYKLI